MTRARGTPALLAMIAGLVLAGSALAAGDLDSARVAMRRQKFPEARALLEAAPSPTPVATRSDSLRVADLADFAAELAWRDRLNMPLDADSLGRAAVLWRERLHGPGSAEVAVSLSHLGRIYRFSNKPDLAREALSRSTGILERLPDRESELATGLVALGNLLRDQGDYLDSRDALARAVEIRRRVQGPASREVAGALVNLALVDAELGDRSMQVSHEREAIEIYDRTVPPDSFNLFITLINHSGTLYQLRQMPEALAAARRAAALETALQLLPRNQVQVAEAMGRALGEAGLVAEAREQFERGRQICASGARLIPDSAPILWGTYAAFERKQGRLDSALVYARRARSALEPLAAEDPSFLTLLGQAQHEEGAVQMSRGEFAGAQQSFAGAMASFLTRYGEESPDLASARHDWVVASHWLGRQDSVLAIELEAERMRSRHLRRVCDGLAENEALRYRVEANDFSRYSLFLASESQVAAAPESLWDQVIRSHALVLDAMAARNRFIGAMDDSVLRPLARKVERARAEESEALAMIEPRRSQRLQVARASRLAAEHVLADRSLRFQRDLTRDGAGFADVARALPRNATLVQYVRFVRWDRARTMRAIAESLSIGSAASRAIDATPQHAWGLFVMKGGKTAPRFIPLGGEDISRAIDVWADGLRAEAAKPMTSRNALPLEAGRLLRRTLWDPIASHVTGSEVVLIVPDASLHRINLATLPDAGGQPLLESAPPLCVITSPRDVVSTRDSLGLEHSVLAVGDPDFNGLPLEGGSRRSASNRLRSVETNVADCLLTGRNRFVPLPASRSEVEAVRRLCPNQFGKPTVLFGDSASRSTFLDRAPRSGTLHVATHGFFLEESCLPASGEDGQLLRVGLAFAGANRPGQGSLVTAAEIASLHLDHTGLVVLSACSSGAGSYVDGEGLFGMARAFALAGVQTTVLSLNAVDDEVAALWMSRFYQARWKAGASVAVAAQDASRDVRREILRRKLPDRPSQWGAFIATGGWR